MQLLMLRAKIIRPAAILSEFQGTVVIFSIKISSKTSKRKQKPPLILNDLSNLMSVMMIHRTKEVSALSSSYYTKNTVSGNFSSDII